jgi:hypothetical protein
VLQYAMTAADAWTLRCIRVSALHAVLQENRFNHRSVSKTIQAPSTPWSWGGSGHLRCSRGDVYDLFQYCNDELMTKTNLLFYLSTYLTWLGNNNFITPFHCHG